MWASPYAFCLADVARVHQFSCIGSVHGLLRNPQIWVDEDGTYWAAAQHGKHSFGVSTLGPGWVFDPRGRESQARKFAARKAKLRQLSTRQHLQHAATLASRLRFGPLIERLLWLIHQAILSGRSSVIRLPDVAVRQALWGTGRLPRHWRGTVEKLLEALTYLHVAEWPEQGRPCFGATTALLRHGADLRGKQDDACDTDCPGHGGSSHHHYLINIGQGFLGVLERLAGDEVEGVREYDFQRKELWRAGKSGRLATVFLPAKLGAPSACRGVSPQQHRLLQALVRETTRATRRKRSELSEAETITSNLIRDFAGRTRVECNLLDVDLTHVGFNGNGKRKGCGYRLVGEGGWLPRAGYAQDDIKAFLDDLDRLSERMGLDVVGVGVRNAMVGLNQLRSLAMTPRGRYKLRRIDVRVYTAADYVERWKNVFEGQPALAPMTGLPATAMTERIDSLAAAMARACLSRRAVARGIGEDHSLFTKRLSGRKPMPEATLEKALEFVGAWGRAEAKSAVEHFRRCNKIKRGSVLDEALRLLDRGISVVPQAMAEKKPHVRWKPYQDQRPTPEQFASWLEQWPDAGLAIILGPVSDLFAIDVDGREAYDVLLDRLGREPMAPKVMSGSGDPHRYHLYFRCPELPTRAKSTPWHPNLEFRGHRGIVIAPPSLHKSGKRYAWAKGRSLDDMPLTGVPQAVLTSLTPVLPAKHVFEVGRAEIRLDGIKASVRTKQFLAGVFADGPGWNEKLFAAACDLRGRGMPIEEAEALLLAGARPWDIGEQELALRTIASAYSQPRAPGRG